MGCLRALPFAAGLVVGLAACSHDWDEHLYEPKPGSSTGSGNPGSTSSGGGGSGCDAGAATCITMDGGVSDTVDSACVDTDSMSGVYFDVEATDSGPIEITGLSVFSQHCPDSPSGAAVYYKEGSSSGHELDACAWTLAGSIKTFPAPGCGGCCNKSGGGCTSDMDVMLPQLSAYLLPIPLCITIPKGARYGLYLALTSGSATFETMTPAAGTDEVVSNAYVKVYVGSGHDYHDGYGAFAAAATGLKDRQAFQGTVHYRHP